MESIRQNTPLNMKNSVDNWLPFCKESEIRMLAVLFPPLFENI